MIKRFDNWFQDRVWWKIVRLSWKNRQLKKENKELLEALAELTLKLEKYIEEG